MKTEGWGNGCAVEIQRLTASKLLPQLTQNAFLLGGRDADTPPETHADLQMIPVLFRLALNAGGAEGLPWDCGLVTAFGFLILVDVWLKSRLSILPLVTALNGPKRE